MFSLSSRSSTETEMDQAPCPYRVVEDCGQAFLLGSVGGGAFHMLKGKSQRFHEYFG